MNIKVIVKEEYYKLRNFGPSVATFDILARATKKTTFYQKKHEAILCYLQKKYEPILEKYQTISPSDDQIAEDCPIWVFWYQGFENAPELVKACLESLKQCAGKHPVIELSKDNYRDYVQIPDYIEEKRKAGMITITQFSDILRVSLLAKYGGCWSDATIFYNSWVHEKLTTVQWYTIKQKPKHMNPMYVSEYRWSAYFQICAPNSIVAKYMQDMFYLYWKDHSQMIDYFLIDYFLALGYHNIRELRKQFDEVPYNNPDVNWLGLHLIEEYDDSEFRKITKNTALFKLNWRKKTDFKRDSYGDKLLFRREER